MLINCLDIRLSSIQSFISYQYRRFTSYPLCVSKMQALVLSTPRNIAVIRTVPVPSPRPNELQIKVSAVALNPVDALYTANPLGKTGRTIGSDFAGTVSARGSNVHHIKLNQRVAGFLQGACSANDRTGAFAEYLVIPHDLVWVVPDNLSLSEAASISLCALTAAQALYCRLGLPSPFFVRDANEVAKIKTKEPQAGEATGKHPLNVVIYGASTSVGLYAAQLVHLCSEASGIPIFLYGAASYKRHGLLYNAPYNYTELVDYGNNDWPAEIRKFCGIKGADLAFDCISEGNSVTRVASTLAAGGNIAIVRSREGGAWKGDKETLPSEPLYGAVWEGLGERVEYQGFTIPASPEGRRFAVEFYKYLSKSPLCPNPVRRMPGGFERIFEDGFALLGPGNMEQRTADREEDWMRPVSGEKLVYDIE